MENVTVIRGVSFGLMMMICMLAQWLKPSRPFIPKRWQYMASNVGIVLFNNLIIGILPVIPFQMAAIASERSWGLLNLTPTENVMISGIKIVLGIAILDVVIYFQHRAFHKVDFLWRLHSMHHIDPMLDMTTGLRFHPLEIVISNFIKVGTILLIGINPLSVIIFEVGLNLLSMFNHSNIAISPGIERVINRILITPALHTIHHSKIKEEINSNYGFSVPWWDKALGTFKARGVYEQSEIRIGIVPMPQTKWQLFPGMLLQPFLNDDE